MPVRYLKFGGRNFHVLSFEANDRHDFSEPLARREEARLKLSIVEQERSWFGADPS